MRLIFRRYLDFGCLTKLAGDLRGAASSPRPSCRIFRIPDIRVDDAMGERLIIRCFRRPVPFGRSSPGEFDEA